MSGKVRYLIKINAFNSIKKIAKFTNFPKEIIHLIQLELLVWSSVSLQRTISDLLYQRVVECVSFSGLSEYK